MLPAQALGPCHIFETKTSDWNKLTKPSRLTDAPAPTFVASGSIAHRILGGVHNLLARDAAFLFKLQYHDFLSAALKATAFV